MTAPDPAGPAPDVPSPVGGWILYALIAAAGVAVVLRWLGVIGGGC